ncbi:hypothetical protein [Emticicia soli]|uniref:Uncharacterized protein n=1 Tax=Emticicia soli TaxID=2027878 RepID=A0ABW5JCE7_9BACT
MKLFLLGFLCISFPFLKFFYFEYAASDMKYNQLTEIKGKIRPYSDVITESKPKKEIGLKFELNEYPNMEFKLYKEYFKDIDYKDFSNALYTDNEVILSISSDEYRKKFSEEIPIKFMDKYFNSIQVFGAKFGNIEIKRIKIRPANNSKKNEFSYLDGVSSYLLIGISALFIYLGTQHWREYKKLLDEDKEA